MVDHRALEVVGEQVADDPQRQLGLLVDERRGLRALRPRLDRLPETLEEDEVALDVLGGGAFGRGADDHAALLHVEALEDVAEADALVVLQPARDAEALAVRDEDDEPAGSEISVVRRAPFDFIGSLTAWTMTSWPRLSRSWILRPRDRPSSSGAITSST